MNKIESIEKAISDISSLMIAYATDGRTETQPKEYQELYIDLDLLIEEAGYNKPKRVDLVMSMYDEHSAS